MRKKIRREVNLDDLINKPVEISELTPLNRVIVGIRMWGRGSSFYKNMKERSSNISLKARMELIDELKEIVLVRLSECLKDSRTCELCISRGYLDVLDDVFSSPEFLSFEIKRVIENDDILMSFPSMPIRVGFTIK